MISTETTPWTCKTAGAALGVCPTAVTRKMGQLAERITTAVLAEPTAWATSGRPDRVARSVAECLQAAGRLAEADPEGFRAWIRQLVESKMSPPSAA